MDPSTSAPARINESVHAADDARAIAFAARVTTLGGPKSSDGARAKLDVQTQTAKLNNSPSPGWIRRLQVSSTRVATARVGRNPMAAAANPAGAVRACFRVQSGRGPLRLLIDLLRLPLPIRSLRCHRERPEDLAAGQPRHLLSSGRLVDPSPDGLGEVINVDRTIGASVGRGIA